MMYTCPHCRQPGINTLYKAMLGPGSQIKCKSCEQPVMVRFQPWLKAALPGGVVMVAAYFIESTALMYGISAVGFAMMIGMHLAWVPLEKAGESQA